MHTSGTSDPLLITSSLIWGHGFCFLYWMKVTSSAVLKEEQYTLSERLSNVNDLALRMVINRFASRRLIMGIWFRPSLTSLVSRKELLEKCSCLTDENQERKESLMTDSLHFQALNFHSRSVVPWTLSTNFVSYQDSPSPISASFKTFPTHPQPRPHLSDTPSTRLILDPLNIFS